MSFAFRRYTDPFVIQVSPTSAATQVTIKGDPKAPSPERGSSFMFVNPNPFCVRLKGSRDDAGGFVPVTEDTGWLILPGEKSVWSTQYPDYVSAMSVSLGSYDQAGTGRLEMSYGTGE